jgi:hypothetical protein
VRCAARQQLSGFLLRQGCHYGRPAWTKLHRPHGTSPWAEGSRLAGLKFQQAVHHIVLEDYNAAVEAAEARRDRLTAQIEAAWCYRFPARVSRELRLRQEEQPRPIREIAWKAQLRLCARYRKLARSGKPANVVTAAIARELAGFIWAIARRVPPAGS